MVTHRGAGRAAARAARQAGAPEHLLGAFVDDVAQAATGASMPEPARLAYEVSGRAAAEAGVPLRALVDLSLTAARLSWQDLPAVRDAPDLERLRAVGGAVLGAVDDAAASRDPEEHPVARPSSTRGGQVDGGRERQAPRWQGPRWQDVVLALLAVLALLLVIGLALGWVRMDLIGGDLQVDLPSVDAEVNAPDVDVPPSG